MSREVIRVRWAAFGLAALSALNAMAEDTQPRHEGVATCASSLCHGAIQPLKAYDKALQNEYTTWSQFDPHSNAYKVLLNKQSQEIARRMGIGPAHQAPACLACHSEAVPNAQRGAKFQLDDGVGCESCHGGWRNGWRPTINNRRSRAVSISPTVWFRLKKPRSWLALVWVVISAIKTVMPTIA